jgi:hypothetical protein
MNNMESSPSFYDCELEQSPDAAASHTPVDSVTTTENSPVGQRRLFPPIDDQEINNHDSSNNNDSALLNRIYNQSQELDLELIKLEAEEEGEGDSNCSADEVEELNSSMWAAKNERLEVLLEDKMVDIVSDTRTNSLVVELLGSEVSVPKAPNDWVPKKPKIETNEPKFVDVDNPGGWDEYTFRPNFLTKATKNTKKGTYTHHSLPTGARPVPLDEDENRQLKE